MRDRLILVLVVLVGLAGAVASWWIHRLADAPPRLDLGHALEQCRTWCGPDRAAWRFDGSALACACDDLQLGVVPARKR
jgi:hypothetical protein